MLGTLLKGNGYEVVTVKNGIEALEILRTRPFDGIVSDILMPVMDGFRLIRECKKDPVLRQIPFIFYTATYTEKKDEEFGLSLGAVGYIVKPAEPDELIRLIDKYIRQGDLPPKVPELDDDKFSQEYSRRVGAKLEKKTQILAESEEKYRQLYENSMDGILLTSPGGDIQAANPAACDMFRQTEEEIIRHGCAGIIDTTDPRFSLAVEERTRTGRFVSELTFFRKGGIPFAGEVSSSTFVDRHGDTRSSMIIRDISELRKQEKALHLANQKLNLMNIVAWHDIYNKTIALRGYVELIRQYISDTNVREFLTREEEILKVIHRQITYTQDYQQIGQQPPRWYRLGNLIGKEAPRSFTGGTISITNEAENLELFADPVIEKVFLHLIDNSAKHGEKVTEIRISCVESATGCTLLYQDNGVGIPEKKRKTLFTKSFGKVDGFHLFFVYDILDISGMKIDETGEPGKGVRFEITIPKGLYRFAGV
jgi:PAS domain S-box-containing protein